MGNYRSAPATARQTKKSKEITTATYQILEADHNKTLILNRAAGIVLTLPVDTLFAGFTVEMIVRTTFAGTWEVTGAADGDLFFGGYSSVSITGAKSDAFQPNGSSNDTLKVDHNSKGRSSGGSIKFILMAPNEWLVSGTVISVGTPATAFADT